MGAKTHRRKPHAFGDSLGWEGLLLARTLYDLPADITTPALTEALVEISNESLRTIIPLWLREEIEAAAQELATMAESTRPSYSRRLTKKIILDWQKPAEQLEREVRAYYGWPKSRTKLAGKEITVRKAHVVKMACTPGELIIGGASLSIGTKHNALGIDLLVPAGKKEMTAAAFLAGYGKALSST